MSGKNVMDLTVKIGNVTFENPVWTASGTFGHGREFEPFLDLKKIGAVVTKTVTLKPREGNPPPRIVETPSGMLNSIGLENKGIDRFIEEAIPYLRKAGARMIVSVAGFEKEDFISCAEKLSGTNAPDAIELNLSCPNVKHGHTKHALIAQDAAATEEIVSLVRTRTKCALIAKLTPNVTDITAIAKAAEAGGADAVALINTYFGMAVDADTMKPLLGNVAGGLSGPAIKPMALKAVWDVSGAVKIPVVGMGGIMTGRDVAEFMLCGASAVEVGTASLVDPPACGRILEEFTEYLHKKNMKSARELVRKLKI